jgi:putative NADPH-quinone reductase
VSADVRRVLVINGHPDPDPAHLCAALAEAYARGASAAGHDVSRLDVGALTFPLVRSLKDYQSATSTADIDKAQAMVKHAQHLVLVFPIWFGSPPALLKGFFEQLLRTGFSLSSPQAATNSLLTGKSARLIVTMGMPSVAFRFLLGGHGVSGLERGLFWVAGVRPIRHSLFGRAHVAAPELREQWLRDVESLGRLGA